MCRLRVHKVLFEEIGLNFLRVSPPKACLSARVGYELILVRPLLRENLWRLTKVELIVDHHHSDLLHYSSFIRIIIIVESLRNSLKLITVEKNSD